MIRESLLKIKGKVVSVLALIFSRLHLARAEETATLSSETAALRQETATLRRELAAINQEISAFRTTLDQRIAVLSREQLNAEVSLRQILASKQKELKGDEDFQVPPTKICFIAPHAYSLFNPRASYVFGGSEVRAWMLGQSLSQVPGNEVSFVVLDHGQQPIEFYNRVKVYRASSLLRIYSSPPEALWPEGNRVDFLRIGEYEFQEEKVSFLQRVNADIYCIFGVHTLSAEVAAVCRREGKLLVLFAGCDLDFSENYHPDSKETNAYGSLGNICYYALMQADLIVTQTFRQAELLRERFGREATTLYNPVDLVHQVDRGRIETRTPMILWVGKADRIKQPELLLQVATQCPDLFFTMVLNQSDPEIFIRISQSAPSNIRILPSVPFAEIENLFAQAFAFVNTSKFEGFPNTFLQCGKFGVPVLSLHVDPDGFIEKYGCGFVAGGDVEQLIEGLKRLISEQEWWKRCSKNIQEYVKVHHDLKDCVRELDSIFKKLILKRNILPNE